MVALFSQPCNFVRSFSGHEEPGGLTFRVIILPQAHRDIDRNADWWAENHAVEQALRWSDVVYDQIETLAV